MHNPEKSIRTIFCIKCGGSKAVNWKRLDDGQKMIAERTASAEGLTAEQKESALFCTRCLYPVPASDPTA